MNILNTKLQSCSFDPVTGYMRSGYCTYHPGDEGTHLVCARVTKEFLEYTRSMGNDLTTPTKYFPGIKPGDKWCLCVHRWLQAYKAGVAPPIIFESSHSSILKYVPIKVLLPYRTK